MGIQAFHEDLAHPRPDLAHNSDVRLLDGGGVVSGARSGLRRDGRADPGSPLSRLPFRFGPQGEARLIDESLGFGRREKRTGDLAE
jgi:hypothetical protein